MVKIEQEVLNLYQKYRHSPPNLFQLVGLNLKRYFFMLIVTALAIGLLAALNWPNLIFLLLGLMLGTLLRDIATFRQFVKTWPVTKSVLDWQEIARRLDRERLGVTNDC